MKIVATNDILLDANNMKINSINEIILNIKSLEEIINVLPTVWSGADGKSFYNKYTNEVIPTLKEYQKQLDNYYEFLKKVYDLYETLDEVYSKNINLD